MSYSYTKFDDLEKTAMVGNRQCVALVSHYAGAQLPWPGSRTRQCGEIVCSTRARPLPHSASVRISNRAITRPCLWARPWTVSAAKKFLATLVMRASASA